MNTTLDTDRTSRNYINTHMVMIGQFVVVMDMLLLG
jgi:hypothetical protein